MSSPRFEVIAPFAKHLARVSKPFDEPLESYEGWDKYNRHHWREDYRDFLDTRPELFAASFPWLLNRGIFMTPGDEEQWTISVQHSDDDIGVYVDAFGEFCAELAA